MVVSRDRAAAASDGFPTQYVRVHKDLLPSAAWQVYGAAPVDSGRRNAGRRAPGSRRGGVASVGRDMG
eukprot:347836-Chlamydomonas_euryale.AAC.1